ncbi:MAG: outer membrane beta-barrel protein [Elusimicrobia bacterium]|nr:outer membrane beta-barrel protein [Elusimicrobiota bacterium]
MEKTIKASFLAALLACGTPGRAGAALLKNLSMDLEPNTISLTSDFNLETTGDSRTVHYRPGLSVECASNMKFYNHAFEWSLEVYYDYNRYKGPDNRLLTSTLGLNLAKIMLTRLNGKDLKAVRPYLLAGMELTALKENSSDESHKITFASPTFGLGLEFNVTSKASLNIEYQQNIQEGVTRRSSVMCGLSYAILGAEE